MNNQPDAQQTIQKLINIVGKPHVLTDEQETRLYRQGRRYGSGQVLAVVAIARTMASA